MSMDPRCARRSSQEGPWSSMSEDFWLNIMVYIISRSLVARGQEPEKVRVALLCSVLLPFKNFAPLLMLRQPLRQ